MGHSDVSHLTVKNKDFENAENEMARLAMTVFQKLNGC